MSLARYRWQNSPYCLEAVFGHLNAESIPLLLEYLNSDNDQLRAFIVWRLTSLGYEFPSDRLQVLRKDIDWKVRLNTLFVCGPDDLAKALDDESAVVRIVAHMLKSE
jgi:HEAT repeat protein